jgi:hypothetical protein
MEVLKIFCIDDEMDVKRYDTIFNKNTNDELK